MHLFDSTALARQATSFFMGQVPDTVVAACRGARNTVFKATLTDGTCWAIRLGQVGVGADFVSGLGWAQALVKRGIPAIVPTHIDTTGSACGHPCSVAPWSDANDVEKVVASLSSTQLLRLGKTMALWSERMIPLIDDHPAGGAGFLRFGSKHASHPSWVAFLQSNLEWRLQRALTNPAWASPGDQHMLRSMGQVWMTLRTAMASAPLSLLAWDIGERNVMLSSQGQPVALVDIDELMIGDPLIAPALAWAGLAIQRLPIDHALAWEEALPWRRGTLYEQRLLACKGYWIMNLASKIGSTAATGLSEPGEHPTVRTLVSDWMRAAAGVRNRFLGEAPVALPVRDSQSPSGRQ